MERTKDFNFSTLTLPIIKNAKVGKKNILMILKKKSDLLIFYSYLNMKKF